VKVAPSDDLMVRYALLAKVGHDFNNVLAVSQSVAEGLDCSTELPPSLRPEVDALMASVASATGWTHRLSRLRVTEGITHDPVVLDDALAALVEKLAGERGPVQVTFAGGAPGHAVRASSAQLERMVTEALSNAQEAGAKVLRIATAEEGKRVRLELADDGEGMSPATLAQAFDPFFTSRGKKRGKGVGLCIVHVGVATLGGDLELESAAGKGTTLRLWLPLI
jgi:C4-dicarboxylate-specific signal transduction histidine kinase